MVLNYKKMQHEGRIADFSVVNDILTKIAWFREFSFTERQNLIYMASIKMYEPGELIFEQGQPSPDLYLIMFGAVGSTMKRGDWRGWVNL